MVSEHGKIVLAGLFVGALAIAAYISQSERSWLSRDDFGLERDNTSAQRTLGNMVSGSVIAGPVAARGDSTAAIAGDLRAARDSLQRHDPGSAQAQPDGVGSTHGHDDQVPALQREVAARTEHALHAPTAAHGKTPTPQRSKSARSSVPSSGKTGRSHTSYLATRDYSNRASSNAKTPNAPVAVVGTGSTPGGSASGAAAPVVASSPSSEPAEGKVVSNVTSAPAEIQPIQPIQSTQSMQSTSVPPPGLQAVPAPPAPQLAPGAGVMLKPVGGPKTRDQVRAEIARARGDGSLPAFGNPDPAGPGGAPSMTGAQRP